ncbi:MAG: hypothetical protein ACOY3P_20310 [Planctomycetota bacterium]
MAEKEKCGTHDFAGCRVTVHRHRYWGGDSWSNRFLVRRPAQPRRGWIRDVLYHLVRPVGRGDPGQFFAHAPCIVRRGRRYFVLWQHCGYDV